MTIQLHRDAEDSTVVEEAENQVAVRRNVVLSAVVGGAGLLLGIAFLARSSSAFDLLAGFGLLVVAALNLPAVASARTPVLLADDHGIRLRVGLGWRGLPWTAIRQLVVEDPASLLREGRVVIVPRDRAETFRRLDAPARWHLRWNASWYRAELSVPLGITTAVESEDLAADLTALAVGRVEVVHVAAHEQGWTEAAPLVDTPAEETEPAAYAQPVPEEDGEPTLVPTAFEPEPVVEPEPEPVPEPEPEPERAQLPEPVLPLREVNLPHRVDVRLEPDPVEDDEQSAQAVPSEADLDEHRDDPLLAQTWPVDAVFDDLAVANPAVTPVIGTKVAHARECLDMSIDELSQRTRIRPHVLEAIEQDDFGACGGDFYARGHLTAISRALGLELEPLLETYEERYAQAPINARRVFGSEPSAGLSGGVRATLSSPRWSLLVGSVLCLTMIWGLARIFAGDPEEFTATPPPSQSAGLAGNQTPITSPKMRTTPMTVHAAYAGTRVVVKDRTGTVLWSGDLAHGKKRKVIGLAPFTVSAENAGAVLVTVKGEQRGDLGTAGEPGTKKFRR